MTQRTPLWTVAFVEAHHAADGRDADVQVAVVAACTHDDAVRHALEVLGEGVVVVWAEPLHSAVPAAA